MPRTNLLGATMVELSALHGEAMPILIELSIPAETIFERYALNNEPVTFNSQVYQPMGASISGLTEGSVNDPAEITITVVNANNTAMGLIVNYWRSVVSPEWIVRLWKVPFSNPDLVAYADAFLFRVVGWEASSSNPFVTFELAPMHLATQKLFPNRSYTTSGGFPHLPPP